MRLSFIKFCLAMAFMPRLSAQYWQSDDVFMQDQRVGMRTMAFNRPDYQFGISLPALGQIQQMIYHSGFAYADLVNSSGNVMAEEALSELKQINFAGISLRQHWLGGGFYLGETWFRLSVDEDLDLRLDYPGDLMKIAWYGNGSDAFLGKRVSLDGLGLHFQQRRNFLVGFSRESGNKRWCYGGNLRFIQGVFCLLTTNSRLGWTTEATDYSWTFDGAMQIRSSGIVDQEDLAFNAFDLLSQVKWPRGNPGFSIDAGASYMWNDQWKSWLNISDVGGIRWNHQIANYTREDVSLLFRGLNVQDYFETDTISDLTGNLLDSLTDQLVPLEDKESFLSRQRGNISLGSSWALNDKHLLMVQLMRQSQFERAFYGVNLSYRFEPWPRFGFAVSGGYHHLFGLNAGLGLCFRLGALVINTGAGNVPAFIRPETARQASFHFGMNLIFGRKEGRYR